MKTHHFACCLLWSWMCVWLGWRRADVIEMKNVCGAFRSVSRESQSLGGRGRSDILGCWSWLKTSSRKSRQMQFSFEIDSDKTWWFFFQSFFKTLCCIAVLWHGSSWRSHFKVLDWMKPETSVCFVKDASCKKVKMHYCVVMRTRDTFI